MRPVSSLELWGGIECTVNRVGDAYFDQIQKTGHHHRRDDIERFAETGFRAMRYPVLWERVAPKGLASADWQWSDERLERLRAHGIRPIAGLLHHGSGPEHTDLLDSAFPEKLADYAAAVAERYPWLSDYTPVNEPLTTARFSALYGLWYPHRRDDRSFVRALLNQVRATVLAMEGIRRVNPRARLIQTEDAGATYSTPALAAQAAFDNHRRWLTFDLLAGRVTDAHPLWAWLLDVGVPPSHLRWFHEHPCVPDVIGLNYYLTSDRYLDEALGSYPPETHGGNGRERYADVEAVRVPGCPPPSHERVLEAAWRRYQIPVALTETHLACTREEQLRWFASAWRDALNVRARGANVMAVTMWSLLGAFDWNSLVTRSEGVYEGGAFDVRSTPPRRTALGLMARALASGEEVPEVGRQPGWWQRPARLSSRTGRPMLITGGAGLLGSAFAKAAEVRGLDIVCLSRHELDVTSPLSVARALAAWKPWAVVNAAGYTRIDDAEKNCDDCFEVNASAVESLATHTAERGARLLTFSADMVFDGLASTPYVESAAARALNVFGASKLDAEIRLARIRPDGLIVRTAACFGSLREAGFLARALREIAAGKEVIAAADVTVSPTYVPHLVDAALDLLLDREQGIWHLVNGGEITWAGLAATAARLAGFDDALVCGRPIAELGLIAPRPQYSALTSERGTIMPCLEQGLADYVRASRGTWHERRSRVRSCGR